MVDNENLLNRMHAWGQDEPEPSAEVLARREVAAALRSLADSIGSSGASVSQLHDVARQLRAQHAIVATADPTPDANDLDTTAAVVGMTDFRDRSPVTGQANPLAPPATLRADVETQTVTGTVTFGPAFEGAPGIVHGGFVAALLDEALGMAGVFSGGPAMTAELTTRFRQHTPIATALRLEARLDSVDGRKVRTSGEIYHGDVVIADGEGLFIAVDLAKFAQLAEAKRAAN